MNGVIALAVETVFARPAYLDDIEEIETLLLAHVNATPVRVPRVEGYVENVVRSMSDTEFKSHFRLSRQTFEFVLNKIGDKLQRHSDGSPMIPAEKQLLMTLWRIGTPDSFRSIHNRFGVGKATAVRAVRRCTHALAALAPNIILWPAGNRVQEVIAGFARVGAFPGVIGAIDGTHIKIPSPKEHAEAYVNRKGFHSIQLVCDHKLLFTNVCAGHVGSVHDARVFRLSPLADYLQDDTKFPNDSHLIGDAAYPLHTRLLVPYADNGHLTRREKNYNFCHSSARVSVERAIGLLKLRWRSLLQCLAMEKIEEIPYHIMASAVLHNICLLQGDELHELPENQLLQDVQVVNGAAGHQQNRGEAVAKRDRICATLRMREV